MEVLLRNIVNGGLGEIAAIDVVFVWVVDGRSETISLALSSYSRRHVLLLVNRISMKLSITYILLVDFLDIKLS